MAGMEKGYIQLPCAVAKLRTSLANVKVKDLSRGDIVSILISNLHIHSHLSRYWCPAFQRESTPLTRCQHQHPPALEKK
jgi:hypothetical protein